MLPAVESSADSFANSINPEVISNSEHKKRKTKKKRLRHEEQHQAQDESAQPGGKRKKRKHNHDTDPPPPVIVDSTPQNNVETVEDDASLKENKSNKRKKKAKDKEKEREKEKDKVTPLVEQTDAEIEANSQASAAALLSAIVATMSNPPQGGPSQLQPPLPCDPHLPPPPPGQHFVPYPPIQFDFPLPPDGTVHPSVFSHLPFLPSPNGNPLSELAFGSNEDVLRALQDLDMSKLANTLKNLGDAGGNISAFPPHMPHLPPGTAPPHDPRQAPAVPVNRPSTVPVAKKTISSKGQKRTIDMMLPGDEQHTNPTHAHMLATRWLNASKLAELVREEDLVYKKGKFSAIEETQLKTAIEVYQREKRLSNEQLIDLIFSKNDKAKDTTFWSEITAAVPLRPIIAVYHHVRRIYHPCSKLGSWQPEEDEELIRAVTDLGQQWEKVSLRVGRMSADCRDRYRNHIVNRDIRVTGPWSKEEEGLLTQIVSEMTVKQGKDIDNDVFWGKVSELMGGKRGRQQCRIKWTDALSKTVKNEGQKPRWSQQDAYILVHKIDSMNVRDDTEIDWKLISDPDWNLWSAHTLQRRWLTLKKSVKGYEDMTHQEIMDILRIKKAVLPAPPAPITRKRKERKVTSAAAVTEPDPRDSNESTPEAGSSTGPGTQREAQVEEVS